MKRIAITAVIVLFAANIVYAATEKKKTMVSTTTTKTTSSLEDAIAANKAALNGTEWDIQLKHMGSKGKAEGDVIIFADDKVSSANLNKLGYAATNFSVRFEDDGTVIWETMQTTANGDTAFWRGDIKDGVMSGVLSKRDKRNNTSDFNFSGTKK